MSKIVIEVEVKEIPDEVEVEYIKILTKIKPKDGKEKAEVVAIQPTK